MKRAKFSRAEKTMLVSVTGLIALLLVLSLWRQSLNALPVIDIPTPRMPQPNAFDVYVRAGNMIVPCLGSWGQYSKIALMPDAMDSDTLDKTPLATRETWVRQNQLALQTLRGGFDYPYRHPPLRSWNYSLPHLSKFRGLASLLAMESRARSEHGDWGGASQSALDLLRFGTDIPRGGPPGMAYAGRTIQLLGRQQLWPLINYLNLAQTWTVLDKLKTIAKGSVSYAKSLQEKKWSDQAGLLDLMRRNSLWQAVDEDSSSAQLHTKFLKNDLVMRHYTEIMDAKIANARRPFTAPQQPITLPAWSWSDPIMPTWFGDDTDIFGGDIADQSRRGRIYAANNEAGNVLLLVALALRAYHLEHHIYPQRLTNLVPCYLARIPADPFGSGEALRYRLAKIKYKVADISPKVFAPPPPSNFAFDSPSPFLSSPTATPRIYRYGEIPYTLYSIGPDGKDDGGKVIEGFDPKTRHYHFIWDGKGNVLAGDVVAGVNF